MKRFGAALLLVVCLGVPAWGADGLISLFDARMHDFGNVPIGPLLSHEFTIKNGTNQTVHIAGLRVSCGCVAAHAKQTTIAPGKSATIYASMDTRRFLGSKTVTIYVTFDQPWYEEVSLAVSAYSRQDITMTQDSFAFGNVRRGLSPEVTTEISFLSGTKVTDVKSESGYVQVTVKETSPGRFAVTAKLRPDTPIGNWFTDAWVKTSQGGNLRIPITVQVEPGLMASPQVLQFEALANGEPVKKSIFIRGGQPFKIVDIQGGDGVFHAVVASKDAKPVHVVTVSFKPGKEGEFAGALKVLTDIKEEPQVEVKVKGTGMKD